VFFPGSRYAASETYAAADAAGREVRVVVPRLPAARPLRGFHPRADGHRLDLIAARHLNDPTAFWALCDANNAVSPDALGTRDRVGIPTPG
jgi:hypothetical protein